MAKENKDIQINLSETGNVVEIRQGDAMPLREPVKVEESGNIKAPGNYSEIVKPDPQLAIVVFNRSSMSITYFENPRNYHAAKVTGTLLMNPELKEFKINENKMYGMKELSQFLNMRKHLFSDREECLALVKGLVSFKGKIETILERNEDLKGNFRSLVDKRVDLGLPERFKLKLPIFVGYGVNEFNVEIGIDNTDSNIEIWLESAELNEAIKTSRDKIMDEQLDRFAGLIKIEK